MTTGLRQIPQSEFIRRAIERTGGNSWLGLVVPDHRLADVVEQTAAGIASESEVEVFRVDAPPDADSLADDARFNFTVVARYAKAADPELIAYHFNLAFPGNHAPGFVRFDCNEAHFADAFRDASLSPLRCHMHPGHSRMTVPSPLLSPLEILDLILRHHLR
jgi:hypothetical protein